MTKYKHKIGPTLFEVVEHTTHLHVIWKDGVPSELQVHRTRDWLLEGHLVRSDRPIACIVKLSDIEGQPFANTGLTLLQAIEVFNAVMIPFVPALLEATEVTHDPIPEHATSAVQALITKHEELQVTVLAHDQTILEKEDALAKLSHQIMVASEELLRVQAEALQQGGRLDIAILDATNQLTKVEAEISRRLATVEVLDEAIRVKSAESTRLSLHNSSQSTE